MHHIILTIAVLMVPVLAWAEIVKTDMPACLSQDLLDELTTYSAKRDRKSFKQLLDSGKCIGLHAGTEVSVISPGFMTATIRYRGVKLYTPSDRKSVV